jgi:3-deoxy-D-manno-octulosonate 8-phosphate phosphatase (KDO 8-P phosphatase)
MEDGKPVPQAGVFSILHRPSSILALKSMPSKLSPQLRSRLKRVKLFLCDVDGVLTDGSIFIGGEREFKRFNIRDGLGLVLARRAGLKVGWVSARPSLATRLRAEELKVDFLVQQGDNISKTAAIENLLAQEKLNWSDVCFVGDDVIDLGPLTRAGLAVAVGDAVPEAKAAAHFTTTAAGGRGAVREAVELILRAQGKWARFVQTYSE